MNRRQFIKISALTGSSATLASCGNPEYHLIRFVPEDKLIPGIAAWKPSICPLCSAGCGINVRVMDGEVEVMRNGQLGLTRMGLAKKLEAVKGCRKLGKKDMKWNDATPEITVDPETYEVRANGELLTCEPAQVLPLAQRYFLF